MLVFAAIKDVVDAVNVTKAITTFVAIKDAIFVTKIISDTKPTENIELDEVTSDNWIVVSNIDIPSN